MNHQQGAPCDRSASPTTTNTTATTEDPLTVSKVFAKTAEAKRRDASNQRLASSDESSNKSTSQHKSYSELCSNLQDSNRSSHNSSVGDSSDDQKKDQQQAPSTELPIVPEHRGSKGQRARERFSKLFFVRHQVLRGSIVRKPQHNNNINNDTEEENGSNTKTLRRQTSSVPKELPSLQKTKHSDSYNRQQQRRRSSSNAVFNSFTSAKSMTSASSLASAASSRNGGDAGSKSIILESSLPIQKDMNEQEKKLQRRLSQGPNPFSFF